MFVFLGFKSQLPMQTFHIWASPESGDPHCVVLIRHTISTVHTDNSLNNTHTKSFCELAKTFSTLVSFGFDSWGFRVGPMSQ